MSEGLPPPQTHACPACGVPVTAGYPRCPRCHATQPAPAAGARTTRRSAVVAGGSTAAGPDRRGALLVGGGVALAAAVVGAGWLATRDDAAGGAARGGGAAVTPDAGDPAEVDEPAEDAPPPRRPAPTDEGPDLAGAMRGLDEALRVERLWAKVRREGTVVVIESALCGEPGMEPVVTAQADALRDGGATAVECRALHGAVVFARGL